MFQLKIRVGDLSRFGDSHGCSEITEATAKTANPKIELERGTGGRFARRVQAANA
jgi:hypothetical protein